MSENHDSGNVDNPYRLPRTVVPGRYDLTLEPDLQHASFTGTVAIAVTIQEPTDTVVLNAAELELGPVSVEAAGIHHDADVSLDDQTERATLTFDSALPAGPATVHLAFNGVLNDKLRGFYRSVFTDDDGNTHTLATTQMEATDARRAFPCWDEPDFKAVFSVTLVVDEDLLAVSNGGELSRTPASEGKVAVTFTDTMSMSTYLVAFIVGPLEATEAVDVDGTPLRVIHPPGRSHLTEFALDAGAFCLRYFTDWFGIPYPSDKLDMVAIPDFAFGAMENLGCVTFRERLLLVDPQAATKDERQAVVDVIAHELAHMWFGNLVTMKWWNGIWLNEAFATFMEMLAADAYRPDWERWVFFGRERTPAFDTDTLNETRPIEFPVISPDDAEGMFDVLTYQKGSAVVRMLQQYLGEEPFRAGIRRYMERHLYGNTETSDLWDALEEETGEPVRRIAESWIFQGGFPEVAVAVDGDGNLELTQRRFSYQDHNDQATWVVPLVVTTQSASQPTRHRVLLDSPRTTLKLNAPIDWVNANTGANGFYRTSYSPDLRTGLVAALAGLDPLERYSLVDDAWAAVQAGTSSAIEFLELAEQFSDETNLYVWELLLAGLAGLDRLVEGDARATYAQRVRALLQAPAERLGPDARPGDDDPTLSLRAHLVRTLAVVGQDSDTLERCRALVDRYLADPSQVEASLGTAALGAAAAAGDLAFHQTLEQAFADAVTPQQRERILHAFGMFRDPAALARTLELSLAGAIRSQDAPYLLRDALANRDNGDAAWQFVSQRWEQINNTFPSNSISRMLSGIRSIRSRATAEGVAAFLADNPIPQGEKQIRQHVERMWVTVALAEREASRFPAVLS